MSHNMPRSWMIKLREKLIGTKPRPVRRPRAKKLLLQAEQLEDRTLLTTWTVTDLNGNSGSGGPSDVTLPYAVAHFSSGDAINFSNCLDGNTITLNGTLTLSHNVTITGPGAANLAVSGGGSVQDFRVDSGVTASISGLTIENGTESGLGGGGGILNTGGTLTVDNCVISNNNGASPGTYDPYGSGGGILNTGSLTLIDSTFENNTANYGGGLANYDGTAFISDCTYAHNTGSSAAGINNFGGGTLDLFDSTVAYNSGYGVDHMSEMDNCIVAGNTSGQIDSGTSGTYTFTSVTGLSNTLAYNNGAATLTFALTPGSNAIGTGDPNQATVIAQNGMVRPSGGVDVGACQGGHDWVVTDPNGNSGSGSSANITLPYANAHIDSGDQITFSPLLDGDIISLNNTLTLSQNVALIGPGAANLAISGHEATQVFAIAFGVTANISGLTIENGAAATYGGGIDNFGTLTLNNAICSGNSSMSGAGIFNAGVLTMTGSTVENNSASRGGGLFNDGSASINDCTIASNTGLSAAGVLNDTGTLSLSNSTVAYNIGYGVAYITSMDNCIVAGNTTGQIYAGTSGTYTVTSTTGLETTLAYNNGAATPTFALEPGSPAIATGDPAQAGAIAQNGAIRPTGSVDVGACQGGFDWVIVDPNGNVGSGGAGDVTLPYAVANAHNGDEITFASCISGANIDLNGTLTISKNVTIAGPGSGYLYVSGNNLVQDFFVDSGVCASISGMNIINGAESGLGGAGGILNAGMLTVNACIISGCNGNSGGTYDPFGSGGGILNVGLLTLSNSTFENNVASYGGGLANYHGFAVIDNCTFEGNTGVSAGGVDNYGGGTLKLSNSTVAYNVGYGVAYMTSMDNCIVAGNSVGAVYSGTLGTYTLTSLTGLAGAPDYNGPTPTYALSPGSSALTAGDPSQAGTTAQNGVIRPAGSVSVGAFQGADWLVTDPNGNAGSGSATDVTLPYAVAHAQNGDSINFASNFYNQTITLNSALTISHNITIIGFNEFVPKISGGNSVGDFVINSGVTASIWGLTIENGLAADGAGIANSGTLSLTDDTVSGNGAVYNTTNRDGAGIYNSGTMFVSGTTINGNTAYSNGGGIFNSGFMTLSNSTVFGNAAYTAGGGIDNTGTMSLISDTVAGNSGWDHFSTLPLDGGGIYDTGSLQMDNTIVANNSATSGPDVYGFLAACNYCLIGNPSGAFDYGGVGTLTGSAGLSTTLEGNGYTGIETLALVPGSQAIDAGDPSQAGTTAEDGIVRTAGAVDMGACEGAIFWDVTDPNGNAGSGSPSDITLPYAVAHAQDGDTIAFDYSLIGQTITLNSPLTISSSCTIFGNGPSGPTVSGGNAVGDFIVNPGAFATINDLPIENGLASQGGGIKNNGILFLSYDSVSDNGANTTNRFGAGIYSTDFMDISYTTINGNTAYSDGGGIFNSGTMSLTDSTVFGNAAYTAGGGIFNSGTLTLKDDTVAGNLGYGDNSALPEFGGGIYNSGSLQMDSTIVAGNVTSGSGPDIYGTIASAHYCLIGNSSGNTITSGGNNLLNVSAGLASALADNNGAPTETLAVLPGSAAIGAGDPAQGFFSQNDVDWPSNPDIGAYQTPVPTLTSSAANILDDAATITINGSGFSSVPADNTVSFNDGVTGTVAAATTNELVVDITSPPTALGSLTAVVTTGFYNSGSPVQVGTEVNATWNVTDPNGNAGSGSLTDVTLPYAVSHALSGDTIAVPNGLGVITLNATLTLTQSIAIDGYASWATAISGNNSVRAFSINSGVTATIYALTIENGLANSGAGIYNTGNLTLSDDAITDCGSPSNTANRYGAGIYNSGTLLMVGSTVSNNVCYSDGGGIYNSGTANLYNDTIFANEAYTDGGGIANVGTLSLTSCTVADNSGWNNASNLPLNGGGIFQNGMASLDNTIVAGDSTTGAGPDIDGSVTANYSLIGNISGTTYSGSNNFLNFSAGLASALAYNGGSVPNLALLPGSVALETGDPAQAGIISQNYAFRPLTPDIGAYQTLMTVTSSTANIPDDSPTITINGTGFSTTPADNTITFNDGVVGTVVTASSTQLVVNVNTPPTSLGNLTALVHSGSDDSGLPVQVGTEVNATWTVTDLNGNTGSGSLTDMTLPHAVSHALSGDTINFAGALSGQTITLNSTLTIGQSYTINGLGAANVAISGNNAVGVFSVNSNVTGATILGLTIENGHAADGAGIHNGGILSLIDVAISNNATLNTAADNYDGAGVYNSGTLNVYGSTINGNSAFTDGGGIYNTGTALLSNSTIFGNSAYTDGGGLFNSGALTLTNDTVSGNAGYGGSSNLPQYGGGVFNVAGATLQMDNTIVAGNAGSSTTGPDVDGTIMVANYCLIGNPSGATYSGFDNRTGSAGLAASLAYNGGPTQTLALLPSSQAHGAGDPGQAGTFSQNGITRPSAPDMGAFQFGPPPIITSVVINQNISALYNAASQPTPGAALDGERYRLHVQRTGQRPQSLR